MGRDKAWIELDGKFLIARVMDALTQVCDEIIVVANDVERFEKLRARVVRDEIPNAGSLGGLYSGLNAARNEWAMAVACDMPFLNVALLQFLVSLSTDCDVVIPSVRDERKAARKNDTARQDTAKKLNLHPLHALYKKTCLPPMRDAILKSDLRMISFHDAVQVRVVEQTEIEKFDPQHLSCWNVNTPEELVRAEQLASQR